MSNKKSTKKQAGRSDNMVLFGTTMDKKLKEYIDQKRIETGVPRNRQIENALRAYYPEFKG